MLLASLGWLMVAIDPRWAILGLGLGLTASG